MWEGRMVEGKGRGEESHGVEGKGEGKVVEGNMKNGGTIIEEEEI